MRIQAGAASGGGNATSRKRQRHTRQSAARAQAADATAKEKEAASGDGMTDWLLPPGDSAAGEESEAEEEGEIAEEPGPAADPEAGSADGALGLALQDASRTVRLAAVRALRSLCCPPASGGGEGWADVTLQLSRRALEYLLDMVGDSAPEVKRSALRAVTAVLRAHAAASPPLRLGDRQLAALVSPALLHFGYTEPELAGWGAVGCAVRLAAHRLLGTAQHPPTTIHRTLRALAAAASAASAAAARRDDGAAVVEAWQATAEVRSILSAAAALGQEDEHAQAMRPSSMAPLLYEPTAADDDDAVVDEAASRPQKRRRTAAGLAAPIERDVVWVAVFHAAAVNQWRTSAMQDELCKLPGHSGPAGAAPIYAGLAERFGASLLPKREQLAVCLQSVAAGDEASGGASGRDGADGSDDDAAASGEEAKEAGEMKEAEEAQEAQGAQAEEEEDKPPIDEAEGDKALSDEKLAQTMSETACWAGRRMISCCLRVVQAAQRGEELSVSEGIMVGLMAVRESQHMLSALLPPADGGEPGPRPPPFRGVLECRLRFVRAYSAVIGALLRVMEPLAARFDGSKEPGGSDCAGVREAESLIQASYELQNGFDFGDGGGQKCVSDMRQVRMFAHVASLLLSTAATECRAALRRAVTVRLAGLRQVAAADVVEPWEAMAAAADGSAMRKTLWQCLSQLLESCSAGDVEALEPRLCYALLRVDGYGRSDQAPKVVVSSLPWQLRLRLRVWNVAPDALLALHVTLRKQGGEVITLPLALLDRRSAVVAPGEDDDDSAEEDDARAEAELAGHSGDSAQQGHAYTTLATLALPAGLRGAYTATAGVVRCFVSETKPAAARSTGAAAGARTAVASGASGAVRGQRKFGVVMLSESEEMRIIATQAPRRFI